MIRSKQVIKRKRFIASSLSWLELLVALADEAIDRRDGQAVKRAVREIEAVAPEIARFYQGRELLQAGEVESAREIFFRVASVAPTDFRVRALGQLSEVGHLSNDEMMEAYFRREVQRYANSPAQVTEAARLQAVYFTEQGDSRISLRTLEDYLPVSRKVIHLRPRMLYDYLNTISVAMAEVGRFGEARKLSQIVIASPYAVFYPEWHETAADERLRERSPMIIAPEMPKPEKAPPFALRAVPPEDPERRRRRKALQLMELAAGEEGDVPEYALDSAIAILKRSVSGYTSKVEP